MIKRLLIYIIFILILQTSIAYASNLNETYKNSQEYCEMHWEQYHDPTAINGFTARWTCTEDYITKYAPHLLKNIKNMERLL